MEEKYEINWLKEPENSMHKTLLKTTNYVFIISCKEFYEVRICSDVTVLEVEKDKSNLLKESENSIRCFL